MVEPLIWCRVDGRPVTWTTYVLCLTAVDVNLDGWTTELVLCDPNHLCTMFDCSGYKTAWLNHWYDSLAEQTTANTSSTTAAAPSKPSVLRSILKQAKNSKQAWLDQTATDPFERRDLAHSHFPANESEHSLMVASANWWQRSILADLSKTRDVYPYTSDYRPTQVQNGWWERLEYLFEIRPRFTWKNRQRRTMP